MDIDDLNEARTQRRDDLTSQLQDLDVVFGTGKVSRDEYERVRATLEGERRSLLPVSSAASLLDVPPLSPFYEQLLRDGDGNEVAYKVAFGALCAGWGPEDLRRALLNPVNDAGRDLRGSADSVVDREVASLWSGAKRYATEDAKRRATEVARARIARLQGIADALAWRGEGQLVDLMALHAFFNAARLNSKLRVGMSARTLSDFIGTTPKTANLSIRRLVGGGWLSTSTSRGPGLAADYELSLPHDAPSVRLELPAIPKEFLGHPVFYRRGLGKASLRTLQFMSGSPSRWWKPEDLSPVTWLSRTVLRRRLNTLYDLGLVDRDDSGGAEYQADFYRASLEDLAELAGVYGTDRTRVERRTRTELERRAFAEVMAKRPELVSRSGAPTTPGRR